MEALEREVSTMEKYDEESPDIDFSGESSTLAFFLEKIFVISEVV